MAATANGVKAPDQEAKKNRPVFELRYGRLKASIWRQDSDRGHFFNVVLARSYKDDAGQWQNSNSLGERDLLEAAKLLTDCYTWIHRERSKARQQGGTDHDRESGPVEDIPF
jgi:hypothetical protein